MLAGGIMKLRHRRRLAVRLFVAGIYAIPVAAFAAAPPHTSAASTQDETVIAARDATRDSNCTTWAGDPSNAQPCPAGSVVWTYPLARSAADKGRLAYVVPGTNLATTTARAVATMARDVHRAAMASAGVTPSTAVSYVTTDAARKGGISPNVAYSTGGQYTNQYGNTISYWVGWNNAGGGNINSIVSSAKQYGCCTNWAYDSLVHNNQLLGDFDRGCAALSGSWSPQQALPGTYPSGVEYDNATSTCGLFPHTAFGWTILSV